VADACTNFAIRNIPLPAGQWTAIISPIEANSIGFKSRSGNSLRIRSDENDATTEDILATNAQELIIGPLPGNFCRFICGGVVLFAQPSGDSDDAAVARFVR
jgi:hypothetical protein